MPRPEEPGVMYALCPGAVRSATDGDWHYVGARQLAVLYGVDMRQCAVVQGRGTLLGYTGYLIPLYPRADGDYNISRVIQDMPWE